MTAGPFPLFPKVGNQPQGLALVFFLHLISQRKGIRNRDLLLAIPALATTLLLYIGY